MTVFYFPYIYCRNPPFEESRRSSWNHERSATEKWYIRDYKAVAATTQ